MGDTIQGLDWMGAETKKKALEKLATFNPKIGYPDKWKDYSSVPDQPRTPTGPTSWPAAGSRSRTIAGRSASRSTAAAGA